MKTLFTHLILNRKLKLLLVLISVSYFAKAQENIDLNKTHYGSKYVKSVDKKIYNLEDFSNPTKKNVGLEVLKMVDSSFYNHPDFGYATHRVFDEAIELVDKRTGTSTQYALPDGKVIFSSSEKPFNYVDENGWYRQIDYRLNQTPLKDNTFIANKQPIHKKIDANTGKTTFITGIGEFSINQNTVLKYEINGVTHTISSINTRTHKVGENGMYVENAFPGVDMQVIFMELGMVKTNYIIKDRSAIPAGTEKLLFEDIITLPEGISLQQDENDGMYNGNEQDWEGSLMAKNQENNPVFMYAPAITYDHSYTEALTVSVEPKFDPASESLYDPGVASESLTYNAYRIEQISSTQFKVTLVVNAAWLLAEERVFPVVVDPVTFTGTSIDMTTRCAVRMGGGGNSATVPVDDPRTTYGGVGCHSTTTVLPAGYMLITNQYPVIVQSGYYTIGCAMSNSFMTYYGPCGRDPRAAGFFWYCNSMFAGTCTGTNLRMDGILSRCTTSKDGELCTSATIPQCIDRTITFTICMQTRCTGGTGGSCYPTGAPATTYVRGLDIFRVDVVGEKITSTLSGGGNICPSTLTNLTLGTSFGVPNALVSSNCTDQMGGTYSWTATCTGGTLGAASGTTTTTGTAAIPWTSPAAAGSYTVTVQVCNTACPAPAGTMCDSKTVTYTVGQAIAPTLSDVTVCNGLLATLTLGNTQAGYTYTWYDGATIASPVLAPTGTSKVVGPYSDVTRQYTVRATAPCFSNPVTINVTWLAVPLPIPSVGPSICPNTSTTLTANCGINCEWYTVAVGGTSIDGDDSYTTPSLSASTTYYVEFNAGAGCTSARVPITVTMGNLTVNATPSAATQVCNPGTQAFDATTSGGTMTAFDDPVCNNVASSTATSGASCSDPSAADCVTAGDNVTRTVTTPSYVTNPMDANSIQSVCIQMTDGCAADTKLWLQSPSGTIFLLAGQSSKADNTGYNTCFGATATTTIANVDDNSTTSGNTFRPAGGMLNAAFIGENPYAGTGVWTLYMNDAKGGGGCSASIEINSFCITFRRDPPISYTWSGAPLAQLTSSTIVNPTFTAPNVYYNYTYTLTVVDKRGCTGTDQVNVFCPDPLPVVFSQFSGVKQVDGNRLLWTTESEKESDYFDILRSNDGLSFESIGKVKAAGNSSIQKEYSFLDSNPRNGINYYKLKQFDNNGDFIETETIQLVNSLEIGVVLLSPNPASKSLDISFHSESNSNVIIQVVDSKGSVIETLDQKSLKGINTLKLNVDNYANGVYNVNINIDGKLSSARFVKQ